MQRPWLLAACCWSLAGRWLALPQVLDQPRGCRRSRRCGACCWWSRQSSAGLATGRPARYPLRLTLLSVWVVLLIHLGVFRTAAPAYDVQAASRVIAGAQADGLQVAIATRYHGQFGFAGRLSRPLLQLDAGRARLGSATPA